MYFFAHLNHHSFPFSPLSQILCIVVDLSLPPNYRLLRPPSPDNCESLPIHSTLSSTLPPPCLPLFHLLSSSSSSSASTFTTPAMDVFPLPSLYTALRDQTRQPYSFYFFAYDESITMLFPFVIRPCARLSGKTAVRSISTPR
jgi:hypothetical protein